MTELISGLKQWGECGPGELSATGSGVAMIDCGDCLPVIDSQTMSARARIGTPRQDRQGDIIEPSGVDWSDYANNPVVKYEHGFSGIVLPIAKSVDPLGNLALEYSIDEDAIYARSYFSPNIDLSYQMFCLIEEGFLRATSIHVIPLAKGFVQRSDGHYVQCSTMLEYSWCTVGVNPGAYLKALTADSKLSQTLALQLEAGTRILNRGTVGNQRLLPSLAKCLQAVEPAKQRLIEFGWTKSQSDEEAMGTKVMTSEEIAKLTPIGLAKALAEPATYDAETVKQLRFKAKSMGDQLQLPEDDMAKAACADESMAKSEDAPDLSTDVPVDAPAEVSSLPMGAQYLTDFHTALNASLQSAVQQLLSVENPDVKNGVQPLIDDLAAKLAEVEGLYSKIYPDQPALVSATADDAESADAMAKSWASQPRSQFQLDGLASRLTVVVSGQVPAAKAKSLLVGTVRDLRLLATQAKSFKPAPSKPSGDFVPKADYDALKTKHENYLARVKDVLNAKKNAPAELPVG